jgi:hypothetical protein
MTESARPLRVVQWTTETWPIGMTITGAPVVNAIPAVCASAPGIRT